MGYDIANPGATAAEPPGSIVPGGPDPEMIREGLKSSETIRQAPAGTQTAGQDAQGTGVRYAILKQTNPDYDSEYWTDLRALYEGGKTLLRNQQIMRRIFPKHRSEFPSIYAERCKRSFYVPYAAEIIDHIIAGVTADPLVMENGSDQEDGKKKELPDFYKEFVEDISPAGGSRTSLNELMGCQLRTALQTGCCWTLVEMPAPKTADDGTTVAYSSRAEQEKAGVFDAYAMEIEPESVIDWELDDDGELIWAMIYTIERRRPALMASRKIVTERWLYYTAKTWEKYEIYHPDDQQVRDDQIIPRVDAGTHSFGRVPLVPLMLPRGLWAMNKMEGLAREHFNKRCALAWGELQSLLPELYEFLGPENSSKGAMIGQTQEDANRATNQPRGQGFLQMRGKDDRAEFIGPDPGPFAEARQSCDSIRDDLHRVMHQMALSTPNSASALKRSAESKQQDLAAIEIVLGELGRIMRKHAEQILDMISRGRQEEEFLDEWVAKGMSEFDAVAVSDLITQALDINTLNVESETFRKRHREMIVRAVLGSKASPEDIEQIISELDKNITPESISPLGQMGLLPEMAPGRPSPGGAGARPPAKKPRPPAAKPGAAPAQG